MKSKVLFIVLTFAITVAQAQTKKSGSSKGKTSSATPMNWGIGLRLGDPLGFTLKRYLPGGKALEFNLGSTSHWGYDYRDGFYDNGDYTDYDYLSYKRRSSISLQVHYLFQKDIPSVNNLQWYWGFGGQIRSKSHVYNYRYRNYYGPGNGDYRWEYGSDKVTDIDFGGDAVIGLEYHLPKAPLSVFCDANILLELLDDPFVFYLQAGAGIRYNF